MSTPHKGHACHAACGGQSGPELDVLLSQLRKGTKRLTGPREAILKALRQHAHPLTIREIHTELCDENCDLATVYRSMHLLEELGVVRRFDFGDRTARYEMVRGEQGGHHHHLVCTECARVVELEDCFPEELERRIATRHGFAQISHRLEFFGLCPECQKLKLAQRPRSGGRIDPTAALNPRVSKSRGGASR